MKTSSSGEFDKDIEAEVQKTYARLTFSGVVLFLVLIGFWVHTCSNMPPDPIPSVECAKISGAVWVPEVYLVPNKEYSNKVQAYCSKPKPVSSVQ